MFEVNEKFDITVVSDIGNEKRCALIIDNFYKDPDSIRDYIETINLSQDPDLMGGISGWRAYAVNSEVRDNLKPVFDNLKKQPIWKKKIIEGLWEDNWRQLNFMCNVMDHSSRDVGGGIPHSDGFDVHFGGIIYLNKPDECHGGTRLYSVDGRQSTWGLDGVQNLYNEYLKKRWENDEGEGWKLELEFEMVYNRCVLYEADLIHAHWYDEDAFTEHLRLTQALFM